MFSGWQGNFGSFASLYFLCYLYFLLIFSTRAKFFYAARRLCLKRKLFLPNEYHQVLLHQHIGFSYLIGIICSCAQKKAGAQKDCKATTQGCCERQCSQSLLYYC
jgi:hypothetical protein